MVEIGDKITIRSGNGGKRYATKTGDLVVGDRVLLSPTTEGKYVAHKSDTPVIGTHILINQGNLGKSYAITSGIKSGCSIDLHRFALVRGSMSLSPSETPSVTYGDTSPYKQCGHLYDGFITVLLSISGSWIYAAVEIYICKNDPNRIIIESYGINQNPIPNRIGIWFDKNNEEEYLTIEDFPTAGDSDITYIDISTSTQYIWDGASYIEGDGWLQLNSTDYNSILPYAKSSYLFKEMRIGESSITIDCCKKCPSCECKTCDISDRFTIVRNPFLISGYMTENWYIPPGNGEGYSTLTLKWNGITIFEISTPDPISGPPTHISNPISIAEPAYYSSDEYPYHLPPERNDDTKYAIRITCNNQNPSQITDYIEGWVEYEVEDNQITFKAKFKFKAGFPYNPSNYGSEYISPMYETSLPFAYGDTSIPLVSKYNYGEKNKGESTLFFYDSGNSLETAIYVECKLYCDYVRIWLHCGESSVNRYISAYYRDDDGNNHLYHKGSVHGMFWEKTIKTASFIFDYLNTCFTFTSDTDGSEYVTVWSDDGRSINTIHETCSIIGKIWECNDNEGSTYSGQILEVVGNDVIKIEVGDGVIIPNMTGVITIIT